jgi:hypothetical protein
LRFHYLVIIFHTLEAMSENGENEQHSDVAIGETPLISPMSTSETEVATNTSTKEGKLIYSDVAIGKITTHQ